MFHFDVLFSNGSQGYFFDYKLVNIWGSSLKKVSLLAYGREEDQKGNEEEGREKIKEAGHETLLPWTSTKP